MTTHSYFVVMIDYPEQRAREAVVDPEMTRRGVVSCIKSGEYGRIEFIHHISDGLVEDVTSELIDEAEAELKEEYRATRADRIAEMLDHVRDHRKNYMQAAE